MSLEKIAPALIKAKKAFGPVLKDKSNSHFKNKYPDLFNCLEAVNDSLLANGIVLFQETFADPDGVTIETVFLHESGEALRCGKFHVPAGKRDPQGFGSALTYARRYSLLTACGIAGEDDDGEAARRAFAPLTEDQLKELTERAVEKSVKRALFMDFLTAKAGFIVTRLADCPADLYYPILDFLKNYNQES